MKFKIRTRIRDNHRLLVHSLMWTAAFIMLTSLSISVAWFYDELVYGYGLDLYPKEMNILTAVFLTIYVAGLLACLWEWWSESCEREDDE